MEKTQGQISENSGSKLKNSGFGISPNLVKFSRTAQKKACIHLQIFHRWSTINCLEINTSFWALEFKLPTNNTKENNGLITKINVHNNKRVKKLGW